MILRIYHLSIVKTFPIKTPASDQGRIIASEFTLPVQITKNLDIIYKTTLFKALAIMQLRTVFPNKQTRWTLSLSQYTDQREVPGCITMRGNPGSGCYSQSWEGVDILVRQKGTVPKAESWAEKAMWRRTEGPPWVFGWVRISFHGEENYLRPKKQPSEFAGSRKPHNSQPLDK